MLKVLSGVLSVATLLVDTYVWHPAISYLVLMLLVASDLVLDTRVQKKPLRWKEVGVRLLVYTALLSGSHLLGTHETIMAWLPHMVMFGLATFHFYTLIRNLGKAHLMNEELTAIFTSKLNQKLHEQMEQSGPESPERDGSIPNPADGAADSHPAGP